VRCPSFAGDPASSLNQTTTGVPYGMYNSMNMPNAVTGANGPPNPWYVTTTKYKAMVAPHFACLVGPTLLAPKPGLDTPAEVPNGVIIPPANRSSQGNSIKNIIDGTSKTIVLAESKEQRLSSWFDGTTAWLVAIPMDLNTTLTNLSSSTGRPPQPYKTQMAS